MERGGARRLSREFKLAALARMAAGENVSALGRELGVRRKLLYQWRDTVRRGGAEALRGVGRQGERQTDLMVVWAELPRSPGHAFYDRLQAILIEAGFDGFAEQQCAPHYAGKRGRLRQVDAQAARRSPPIGATMIMPQPWRP